MWLVFDGLQAARPRASKAALLFSKIKAMRKKLFKQTDLRYAAAFRAGFSGIGARGVAILATFTSIPFVEDYLGDERFGLYLTLLSFTAFLSFTDFGVGNGLKALIAKAVGLEDNEKIRSLITNAFVFFSSVAVVGVGTAWILKVVVPWPSIFNVSDPQAVSEAEPAIYALMLCFFLSMPLAIVRQVQQAIQKGHLANTWEAVGSIATFLALMCAIQLHAGLPTLIFAIMGAPLLVKLANTLWFFGHAAPHFSPSLGLAKHAVVGSLLRVGGLFVVLQVASAGTFMSDNIIVAQIIGPDSVQDLALPAQLFGIISTIASIMLIPLWPAYGEASSREDVGWIRRSLKLSTVLVAFGAFIGGSLLALLTPWILELWVGGAVEFNGPLVAGLIVWKTLESTGMALAVYLNGILRIRLQVLLAILLLVAAVPMKILSALIFGVAGIPWATSLCYAVITLVPLTFVIFIKANQILK